MRAFGGKTIALGSAVVLAALLASCSTAGTAAPISARPIVTTAPAEHYDGPALPPKPEESFGDPSARWLGEGRIEVITRGSSTCPASVESVEVEAADRLTLVIASGEPESGTSPEGLQIVCTSDLSPTAHALDLPDGVDGIPLSIELRSADDDGLIAELSLD